jgi:hypothetical protein
MVPQMTNAIIAWRTQFLMSLTIKFSMVHKFTITLEISLNVIVLDIFLQINTDLKIKPVWPKVTRPKELGGLGIPDLQCLNWALRVRWLWLKKADPNKPWAAFHLQSYQVLQELFAVAVATQIGDGTRTLFWRDRWFQGRHIEDFAPHLFRLILKRTVNRRTVSDALSNSRWVQGLQGIFSGSMLHEFLILCELISCANLQQGVPDRHFLHLSTSRQYSAKSAYEASFQGSNLFDAWERIWKIWAPLNAHFSSGWCLTIAAGPQTDWPKEIYPTQSYVCSAIKKRNLSIICWSSAYLRDNFGSSSSKEWGCLH